MSSLRLMRPAPRRGAFGVAGAAGGRSHRRSLPTTSVSHRPLARRTPPHRPATDQRQSASSTSSETSDTADDDMSAEEKPSYPEGYKSPAVWDFEEQEGSMGGMNRPTAGSRFEKELPKGDHPLQLYSLGTPNGQKVTILLEELNDAKGVEYDGWKISIFDLEQFGSDFVAANPNSKIPALLDYDLTPPLRVFETGSILKYVAEKHGAFIPEDPRRRVECFNWLFWQHGGAPFIGGGFGHFYNYAPVRVKYAIDRYTMETKRQLDVLDKQLEGRDYIVDEYFIADMAVYPWVQCIDVYYKAADFVGLRGYSNVEGWRATMQARPAVARGMRVNRDDIDDAVVERHSAADFK